MAFGARRFGLLWGWRSAWALRFSRICQAAVLAARVWAMRAVRLARA